MTNDIGKKTEGLCENDKELEEDVIIDEDGDLSPKQKRIFVKMLAKFIRCEYISFVWLKFRYIYFF